MIYVVDAIMGVGKTSAAINYMNEGGDKKFIYITPYLTEVDRICRECSFRQPVQLHEGASKIIDLKRLLNAGSNIVTTHAMFHLFDDEIIDLCYDQGYELIMDEVTDVVQSYNIKRGDLNAMLNNYVTTDPNGIMHWTGDREQEKYAEEMRLCDLECLALYQGSAILWLFPVKVFNAFRNIFILTYMFDAQLQRYYYDYYGVSYQPLYVKGDSYPNFYFTDEPQVYRNRYDYKSLINVLEDDKLNLIGDSQYALSKTWFDRNKGNVLMDQLRNNVINFYKHKKTVYKNGKYVRSSTKDALWTTFKDYRDCVKGKGYAKGFLSLTARATNDYRDRTAVAYLANRYISPVIVNFFLIKGISVDEDRFALSEMLQFIWRSGIRDGKHITVYIPSKRMRTLLAQWIGLTDDN